jgi:hypothetical protein
MYLHRGKHSQVSGRLRREKAKCPTGRYMIVEGALLVLRRMDDNVLLVLHRTDDNVASFRRRI